MYLLLQSQTAIRSSLYRFPLLAFLSVIAGVVFASANSRLFLLLEPFTDESCLNGRPCTIGQLVGIAKSYSVHWSFLFAA